MSKKFILYTFLLIIAVITIGFLVYIFKAPIDKSSIKLTPEKKELSILDKYPMKDELGKKITYSEDNKDVQIYYEFQVESSASKNAKYKLVLNDSGFNNSIHSNYIKVYLTDDNNNPLKGYDSDYVPTLYSLSNSKSNNKVLFESTIKPEEIQRYILRIWIGDAYTIGFGQNEFKVNLNLEVN